MKAKDYPIELVENGHEWIRWKQDKYLSCRRCMIVRRADGKNKPCPGPVKITLRGK